MLDDVRLRTFERLESLVGNTPLHEIRAMPIPNGNRILAKLEYEGNPTGSHYDRVYVHLLKCLEDLGEIRPDRHHLVETTSGNAGAAFARLCRELGYDGTVIVPEDLPARRIINIAQYGVKIIKTPSDQYVQGCARRLREILASERVADPDHEYHCPNHSRRIESTEAMEQLAQEVLDQTQGHIDYFVAAVGNGTSILGPGRVFKRRAGARVVAWDPIQAPVAFDKLHPGRYRELFGVEPGDLGNHHIYGTGVLGIKFPLLEQSLFGSSGEEPVVDSVQLVADDEGYARVSLKAAKGEAPREALQALREVPDLSVVHSQLGRDEGLPVGYSSAGSLAVALRLCETVRDKTFVVIFYDDISKY